MVVVVLGRVHSLPEDGTVLLEVTPTWLPSTVDWFPCGGAVYRNYPNALPGSIGYLFFLARVAQDVIKQEKTKNKAVYISSMTFFCSSTIEAS